jgi:hypothetical protein
MLCVATHILKSDLDFISRDRNRTSDVSFLWTKKKKNTRNDIQESITVTFKLYLNEGRAIAQAVSHRSHTTNFLVRARFSPWWTKLYWDSLFLKVIRLLSVSIIPPWLSYSYQLGDK